MNKVITLMKLSLALSILSIVPARAEAQIDPIGSGDICPGPIFSSKDVMQPARIIFRSIPEMTPAARAHDVHGRVKLEAVLCRTGRVTDVRVIEELPFGMTAQAVESVLATRFKPAEMKWHTVSQRMGFEFEFNGGSSGSKVISLERAAGRLIDRLEVIGYRRLNSEQIMKWISTRPGEVCDPAQLRRDLESILKTGFFIKPSAGVFAEQGPRGNLTIIFEAYELPLISEVKFEGLKDDREKILLEALLKERIDLRSGSVDNPEALRNATLIISEALKVSGQRPPIVEVRHEYITGFAVVVTFVVSRTK